MTTEELDERLRSHGDTWRRQDYAPPSLDGMLDVAVHRGRRPWRPLLAVAASVLVVAGVAAIPIIRHAQHRKAPAAVAAPAPLPATIRRNGSTFTRAGAEAWKFPVLDEHDPAVVWIYAEVQGGPSCTFEPIAHVVSETADSVSVEVATFAPDPRPSTPQICHSIKLPPKRLQVTLQAPLGSRQLVDASTGTAQDVLDPAAVPTPQFVPAGYEAAPLMWSGTNSGKFPGVATRAYQAGANTQLEIDVGPSSELGKVGDVVLDRPTVRGHPAIVWQSAHFDDLTCLTWTERATRTFRVCSAGSPAPLDAATLVRVADSLR
jgi:hypothetical protein